MIWEKIAEYAKEDKAIPHLLTALYHMFTHWGSQAAISIIGTIVIAILAGQSPWNKWFYISCIAYIILILGTLICQRYQEWRKEQRTNELLGKLLEKGEIEQRNRMLVSVLNSVRTLEVTASAGIYRNARKIKHKGWVSALDDMREAFGFQTMAMSVCQEVYRFLSEQYGLSGHTVTVFQRFEQSEDNSICKMIAYSAQSGQEPLSYSQKYTIPKTIGDRISSKKFPFHTRIFAENNTRIRVLIDNSEVLKNFKFHKNCEARERAIEQYIGIPMKVCNRGVTFILQVDCNQKNAFGATEEEVVAFANAYLYQFASQLALYYEMDRMVEVANNHELKSCNTEMKEETEHVKQSDNKIRNEAS